MSDPIPNYTPYQSTPPLWAGDPLNHDTVMRIPALLDAAQFPAVDAAEVRVTANTAANLEVVPVAALKNAIPAGAIIPLGAANSKKFLFVKTLAPKGATSLAVNPLVTAVAQDDKGIYLGVGRKSAPSGILVGRTFAERESGAAWGPADPANDKEFFLTTRECADLSQDNTTELYKHHQLVKINYLPGITTLSDDVKTKIESLYTCTIGKD